MDGRPTLPVASRGEPAPQLVAGVSRGGQLRLLLLGLLPRAVRHDNDPVFGVLRGRGDGREVGRGGWGHQGTGLSPCTMREDTEATCSTGGGAKDATQGIPRNLSHGRPLVRGLWDSDTNHSSQQSQAGGLHRGDAGKGGGALGRGGGGGSVKQLVCDGQRVSDALCTGERAAVTGAPMTHTPAGPPPSRPSGQPLSLPSGAPPLCALGEGSGAGAGGKGEGAEAWGTQPPAWNHCAPNSARARAASYCEAIQVAGLEG